MHKNGKCQQPERPAETVRVCTVSHTLSVCVCVCVYVYPHVREKVAVGETEHLYEMGKRKKHEDRIKERTEKQG